MQSDDIKTLESELHMTKEERNKLAHQLGSAENKILKLTTTLKEQSDSIKILESVKSKLNYVIIILHLKTAKKYINIL